MLEGDNSWKNLFGDGKAGKRIVGIIKEKIPKSHSL